MKLNQAGAELIKSFEGLRLKAYPDPASGGDPWTIGYGHTGPEVHSGLVITREKAEQLFSADSGFFSAEVARHIRVPLNDNQFSALVSFAYNVKSWRTSRLFQAVNAGKMKTAAALFLIYIFGDGHKMPGLVRRRLAEQKLFLTPA